MRIKALLKLNFLIFECMGKFDVWTVPGIVKLTACHANVHIMVNMQNNSNSPCVQILHKSIVVKKKID